MSGYTSGKATHDPRPWLHDHHVECHENGGRMATNNGIGNIYDPRPEYDNHNPMLADFRSIISSRSVFTPRDLADFWLEHWEEVSHGESAAHIDHAHRVLSKLAALS